MAPGKRSAKAVYQLRSVRKPYCPESGKALGLQFRLYQRFPCLVCGRGVRALSRAGDLVVELHRFP